MRTILAAAALVASLATAHAGTYQSKTTCVRTDYGAQCSSSSYFGPTLYDNSAKVVKVPAPETYRDALEAQGRDDKWVAFCKPIRAVDDEGVTRLRYAHPGCEFGRSE